MSHIHEALKRAQREKDTLSLKYGGIIAARGKKRGALGPGAILGVIGIIVFISLAFAAYSWLDFGPTGRHATAEENDQIPASASSPVKVEQAEAFYQRAKHFHKKGDLGEAKRYYQEALGRDPGHVDALNNLGVICLSDKDFPLAQASFEKAIRLRPGRADPFYNMACLYALKGQTEDGLAYLEKAFSLNPAVRDWARKDGDLDHLRKLPEFERILLKSPPIREGSETAPSLPKIPRRSEGIGGKGEKGGTASLNDRDI